MKEKRKEVLLMFSGGLDSTLSMFRLLAHGYKVKLIHFDNGCSISINYETEAARKYEKQYGKDKVEYVGRVSVVSLFRENELEIGNMPLSEIQSRFGDCTISQIRCLNCRTAMYYEAIIYCIKNKIKYLAEGARKNQYFAIEQPALIDSFRSMLKRYDIELLLPVYNLSDDYERDHALYKYNNLLPPSEDKCILGMPLSNSVPNDYVKAVQNIFEKRIEPNIDKHLQNVDTFTANREPYKGDGNFKFI